MLAHRAAAEPRSGRAAPIGAVVIGRNEGERLRRCLESVVGRVRQVVYVDSGSSDGSIALAVALGVEVLRLDLRQPFTAARARNAGFARLGDCGQELRYVQFVDGDCEVVGGWFEKARAFLEDHPEVAVVCGRRRERHPEHSVYNMLCDIEWDTPVGEAKACGGDALMRCDAFRQVNGYRPDLIAGEEPDLCVRLRAAGWKVWRIGEEMTLHDAAMTRFAQWWTRSLRAGYSFAAGAWLHGSLPERHKVREWRSAWFWGFGLPVLLGASALIVTPWVLAGFAAYPLQVVRLAARGKRTARENWWRALFLVAGKFPEMLGQTRFMLERRLGRQARLIEYK